MGAGGAFFATAFLGAVFLTDACFFATLAVMDFLPALLAAVLFAETEFPASAARLAAQRFFRAVTIALLPAALSLRFGFVAAVVPDASDADSPLIFAHLAF